MWKNSGDCERNSCQEAEKGKNPKKEPERTELERWKALFDKKMSGPRRGEEGSGSPVHARSPEDQEKLAEGRTERESDRLR